MKSRKMPLFYMPMSQNNRVATQISVLLHPMREIDEILIMAKVLANIFSNL